MNLPKFIFVHILKTGGTTFRHNILEKFYKERYLYDGTFKVRNKKVNKRLKDEKKPVIDFSLNNFPPNYKNALAIFGHFRIEKYEHLNLPFVTFLRDPIERIISLYFYHKHLYNNITVREIAKMYENHMTYILGSDLKRLEFIGILEHYNESIEKFCRHFGIAVPERISKKRVSRNKKKISKEDKRYIRSLNEEDYKLYNKALEIFHSIKR